MVAAGMLIILVVLTGAGVAVGSVVVARHRAQAAADLAALAGAGRVASGQGEVCASVTSVAQAMQARVSACTVEQLDVVVAVDVSVSLGRLGVQTVHAAARAGPEQPDGRRPAALT